MRGKQFLPSSELYTDDELKNPFNRFLCYLGAIDIYAIFGLALYFFIEAIRER